MLKLLNVYKIKREDCSRRVTIPVFQTSELKPLRNKVYVCGRLIET